MFSALTGRQVHEGETTNEELLLAMTQPAVSLGDAAPHLPPELVEIVDSALAFDKEDRWPSARAMRGRHPRRGRLRPAGRVIGWIVRFLSPGGERIARRALHVPAAVSGTYSG